MIDVQNISYTIFFRIFAKRFKWFVSSFAFMSIKHGTIYQKFYFYHPSHCSTYIFLFLPSMRLNLVLQNQYLRSKINHNPKIPFPDGQNNVKMAAHASKLNSENLLIKEHVDETFIKALMDIPFAYLWDTIV